MADHDDDDDDVLAIGTDDIVAEDPAVDHGTSEQEMGGEIDNSISTSEGGGEEVDDHIPDGKH